MVSLFEHAGGEAGLHRLEAAFYATVLTDPLLQPLFGDGQPQHVDHLTAFTAESFGGPDRFSRELGGFAHLIEVHRGLRISEAQRARFVELYMAALDSAGMPDDEPFRRAVREHVDFGSQVALQNSNATTDDELHPLREVPRWTWDGDTVDEAEASARRAGAIVRVDEHDLPWMEYRPDGDDGPAAVRVKALTYGQPGAPPVQFVEYAAGHADPVHRHDTGEVMVITEGELWLDGTANGVGSVVYIPGAIDYSLRAGDAGARFFRIVTD